MRKQYMLRQVALFLNWKHFKGYYVFKMDSKSNLPVRNQGKNKRLA